MATLYTEQSKNVTKTWLLMTVFFVVVILFGWFFSFYYDNPNILYFFVAFSVLMNFFSYWFSDKIVLKLAGAKEGKREEYFDLYTSVENLSIAGGLPMPKVYVVNDVAPNAFATGRDKNHAVVCATTGLLALLNKSELEGVMAHELSHIGNRDMLLSTVVVVLVGFVTILADVFTRSIFWGGHRRSNNKGGNLLVIVGIVLSILAPIFAMLIQLANMGAKIERTIPTITSKLPPLLLLRLCPPQKILRVKTSAKIVTKPTKTTTTVESSMSRFPIWESSCAITPSNSLLLSKAKSPVVAQTTA